MRKILEKINSYTWRKLLVVIFFLRIVVPPLVLFLPLLAFLVSSFLDAIDGYVVFRGGYSWKFYNRFDKILDYWWYIFVLVYFWNSPVFVVALVLFVLRSVGQLLTVIFSNSSLLLYFPNIFENYFVAHMVFRYFLESDMFTKIPTQGWVLVIVTLIAVLREYQLHIKKNYAANYVFDLGIDWRKNK